MSAEYTEEDKKDLKEVAELREAILTEICLRYREKINRDSFSCVMVTLVDLQAALLCSVYGPTKADLSGDVQGLIAMKKTLTENLAATINEQWLLRIAKAAMDMKDE